MAMKCPGCGTEIADGSEYCDNCGGKISGLTIDYSQKKQKASDVFEPSSDELPESESFDEYDEHMANLNWIRFTLLLFAFPFLAFLALAEGLVEKRTDLFYVGAFFIALSILMIALAVKFYKGDGSREEKERRISTPKFFRRI